MFSDATSFTFITSQGHPESGWVTFSASTVSSSTVPDLSQQLDGRISSAWAKRPQMASVLAFCGVLAAYEFVFFHAVPIPWNAYPLRSLQLALPLLFARLPGTVAASVAPPPGIVIALPVAL